MNRLVPAVGAVIAAVLTALLAHTAAAYTVSGGTAQQQAQVHAALASRPDLAAHVTSVQIVPDEVLKRECPPASPSCTELSYPGTGVVKISAAVNEPGVYALTLHGAAHQQAWSVCDACTYNESTVTACERSVTACPGSAAPPVPQPSYQAPSYQPYYQPAMPQPAVWYQPQPDQASLTQPVSTTAWVRDLYGGSLVAPPGAAFPSWW